MKNSEVSLIKIELRKTLDNLKTILKDNSKFFTILIKQSVHIGKEFEGGTVFYDHIKTMIREEYPELHQYEDGPKLLDLHYDFVKYLCMIQDNNLRTQIEEEIYDICSIPREIAEEINIIGDIHET